MRSSGYNSAAPATGPRMRANLHAPLTMDKFIKDIPQAHRRHICMELDADDRWELIAGLIPEYPNATTLRYSQLHIKTFARQVLRPGGSPTDKMLKDWQTQMPTIEDLIQLLLKANYIDLVNYMREKVLQIDPIPAQPDFSLVSEPIPDDIPSHTVHGLMLDPAPPPPNAYPGLNSGTCSGTGAPTTEDFSSMPPSTGTSISMAAMASGSLVDAISRTDVTAETEETIKSLRDLNLSVTRYTFEEVSKFTDNFNSLPLKDGGRLLGKGGYGEVFLGKDARLVNEVDVMLAVKRFNQSSLEYLKQFQKELNCIVNCEHENLLKIVGVCLEIRFCVIYEFMDGYSLEDRLEKCDSMEFQPLTAGERLSIAVDVARGIQHLHNQSPPIVHRDVKSANILLTRGCKAKVGDYGLARVQQAQQSGSFTNHTTNIHGSTHYMPPESFKSIVSTKWDVYSFGVVLLELLFGTGPIHIDSQGDGHNLLEYITNCDDDEEEEQVDPRKLVDESCGWTDLEAKQILEIAEKCAAKYKKRPSMSEVLQVLESLQVERNLQAV